MAHVTEAARTGAFAGDDDTQRSGRFSVALPAARSKEDAVRGAGTQGAALHQCGAGVGDVRLLAFAPGFLRGGREPGGVRHAECTEVATAEAGDGLTAMPLLLLRSAARTAGVERETPRHASVMHERALSLRRGSAP